MTLYACRRSLSVSCLSCRIDGGVSAREIVAVIKSERGSARPVGRAASEANEAFQD